MDIMDTWNSGPKKVAGIISKRALLTVCAAIAAVCLVYFGKKYVPHFDTVADIVAICFVACCLLPCVWRIIRALAIRDFEWAKAQSFILLIMCLIFAGIYFLHHGMA